MQTNREVYRKIISPDKLIENKGIMSRRKAAYFLCIMYYQIAVNGRKCEVMLDLIKERVQWAEELWGIKLHPGQVANLYDERSLQIHSHDRRWGKSTAIIVDVCTYALAYPDQSQYIFFCNHELQKVHSENIRIMLEKAQDNPVAVKRFPFLKDFRFAKDFIYNKDKAIISWGISGKPIKSENQYNRYFVDDCEFNDLNQFKSILYSIMFNNNSEKLIMYQSNIKIIREPIKFISLSLISDDQVVDDACRVTEVK